jgi:peptidoglycan/xylan/chitin deacetylase (PgdA/CDA1 family)
MGMCTIEESKQMQNSVLPILSLTFDDGFRCQFEEALPILNQYGIPATFFLIANQQPTHENHQNEWLKIDWCEKDIAMLKTIVQSGHEIGSHSVTHDPVQMPRQPEFEAVESKRLIEKWIGTDISSFCYPYYASVSYLEGAVRKAGYRQARFGRRSSYYHLSAPLGFNIDCRQASNQDKVQDWIKPSHWHVLTFHGIGGKDSGWEPVSVDHFAVMMADLAEMQGKNDVEIVTFKEGANRFRRDISTASSPSV